MISSETNAGEQIRRVRDEADDRNDHREVNVAQRWLRHCALIMISGCVLASITFAQTIVDKNSGIALPETLGTLKRTGIEDDETQHPGLGTTVYYNAPGLKATIYIYTAGQATIPDGIKSHVMEAAYEAAKSDLRSASKLGVYTLTSEIASGSSYLIPASKSMPAFASEFSYGQNGAEFASWLYMTGAKNRIIKVRMSTLIAEKRAIESTRRAFLQAIGDVLRQASAGGATANKHAKQTDSADRPYTKALVHDVHLAERYATCSGRLLAYATFNDDVELAKHYVVQGSAYLLLAGTLGSLDSAKNMSIKSMDDNVKLFTTLKSRGGLAAIAAKFGQLQTICSFEGVPNREKLEDYFSWVLNISAKQDQKGTR